MANFDQMETVEQQRLRGEILELLYQNQRAQKPRRDSSFLWAVLRKIGFSIGKNDVATVLQDLMERRYITFEEDRNEYTNAVTIRRIGILPAGRDIVERTVTDPAVLII